MDKADEETDRRLAKHIVALHFDDPENSKQNVINLPTLTAYISYARQRIHPQLSDEAAEELTRGYVEMRRRGYFLGSSKKIITATPRQIESLILLSEALARIRFSEVVEKRDVTEAFRLLEVGMQQFNWSIHMKRKGRIFGMQKIGAKKIPEHVRCHKQTDLEKAKATLLLATLPKSLPCRDKEMHEITTYIKGAICDEKCLGRCLYVHGVPGTGKTPSVLAVIRSLKLEVDAGSIKPYSFNFY